MIQYLLWRLITGKTTGTIEINFMLAGHTKFAPDQHFGTIKKSFSRTFVSSLPELSNVSENQKGFRKAIKISDI